MSTLRTLIGCLPITLLLCEAAYLVYWTVDDPPDNIRGSRGVIHSLPGPARHSPDGASGPFQFYKEERVQGWVRLSDGKDYPVSGYFSGYCAVGSTADVDLRYGRISHRVIKVITASCPASEGK